MYSLWEGNIRKKHRIILLCSLVITVGLSFYIGYKLRSASPKAEIVVPPSFTWSSLGAGMGGRIPKVTIDQSSSNIIYAGADVAGNFKSIDGGETWAPINSGLDSYNSGGITVDSGDHNILYTTTLTGVYKSTDAGANWINKGILPNVDWVKGNSDDGTVSIAQSKSDRTVLYARSWTKTDDTNTENNFDYSVYRSDNQGESWVLANGGLPLDTKFFSLAIDPLNANTAYLGTEKGIYKTSDAGTSWSIVDSLNSKIHTLLGYDGGVLTDTSIIKNICTADTTSPAQYSGSYEQCLVDYENGSTDHKILGAKSISSLVVNPANSNHILALSKWGHVYESKDAGSTWREIYHRDNPTMLNDPGHLDINKNYTSFDRDWMSFDSNVYNNHQQTSIDRDQVSFGAIKIDINPDAANLTTCASDIENCHYNIYVNIHYGETRGRTMWRINSANIQYDGFTQDSTPPGTQSIRDNEKWEVIQNFDPTGGNLNSSDTEWFAHDQKTNFLGVDTFELDLQSPFPNRTIVASGMTSGIQKGIASATYKDNRTATWGGMTDCSYKYEWSLKWKGLENYVVADVLYDPLEPRYVYSAVMDNGFFQSSDGGSTYKRSLDGVKISSPDWCNNDDPSLASSCFGGHGSALAATIVKGTTNLYLSLTKWLRNGSMIFKSIDHGLTWENASGLPGKANSFPPMVPSSSNGYGIGRINIDPNNSSRIIIPYTQFEDSRAQCITEYDSCKDNADCRNLYTEPDLARWKENTCGTDPQYNNPNLVIGNDRLKNNLKLWKANKTANATSPIWVTEDSGATWNSVGETGLPDSAWGYPVFDSVLNSNDLYYGVFDGNKEDNSSVYGIYKTHINTNSDGLLDWSNATWEELNINIDKFILQRVTDLAINPFDHKEIYAINDDFISGTLQLIRSKDSGANWEKVNSFQYSGSKHDAYGRITFDPYRLGRISITIGSYTNVGSTGIVFSEDSGDTWRNESYNMANKATNSLAFHPFNPLKMLAATNGTGLSWSYDVKSATPELYLRSFTFKNQIDLRGDAPSNITSVIVGGETVALKAGNFTIPNYNLSLGQNTISLNFVDGNGTTLESKDYSITRRKAGDVNGDGFVTDKDLAGLNFQWGKTGLAKTADFNEDNIVNKFDLAGMNFNW